MRVMKENHVYSNLHVHTPHSFSFFNSIEELVETAAAEKVSVLGINDFDTWEGFAEFGAECEKRGIFPSFGVEVMALSVKDKKTGMLANDPKNPGRVYLCGKGMARRPPRDAFSISLRERIGQESAARMKEAVGLTNRFLDEKGAPFRISYVDIEKTTASGWVRERHIAKALAEKILESGDPGAMAELLELSPASLESADLQEAARSSLLKAGGPAYVPEEEGAFPSIDEAKKLFLALGGIPAYPVLADGAGKFTDWEDDPAGLCRRLGELGFAAAEFIPHRNTLSGLMKYADALEKAGFIITAGSEHNSPAKLPLKPAAKDAVELPPELLEIFFRGACCVAAHQERVGKGDEGFIDPSGIRTGVSQEVLFEEGKNKIRSFLNG